MFATLKEIDYPQFPFVDEFLETKQIKMSINWKPLLSQNRCLQIGIAGLKQTFPRVHFSYRLILRGYYKKSICLSANICGLS